MRIKSWFTEKNFTENERYLVDYALTANSFTVDGETEKALQITFIGLWEKLTRWIPKSCIKAEVLPTGPPVQVKKREPNPNAVYFSKQYVQSQGIINIRKLIVTARFHYLWMKTVTGVNLSHHCYNCLVGSRVDGVAGTSAQYKKPPTTEVYNMPLKSKSARIYYLCGVSEGYAWNKNFHLAFMESEGETVEYESNGVYILVENAKQLPISEEYNDPNDPNIGDPLYRTCRNWQFAHYCKKHFTE